MSNLKAYCKKILPRFGQFLYLTISNFKKNNLWESASACAFGFIFSFIPIMLIIFTVLAGILRVNSNIYNFVLSFTQELENFVDIKPAIDAMANMTSFKAVNIFLGIWVVWMARKLFNSIIIAMKKVFRSVSKRKTWIDQIVSFILEFIFVFVIALVTIIIFIFSKILELDFFQNIFSLFPKIFTPTTHNLMVLLIYLVLFFITVIAYRFVSGSKPMLRRCIFYAALSTGVFFLVSFFINMFMNTTNYNAIYGTISSLVLLMIKVYFFFVIFLFGANVNTSYNDDFVLTWATFNNYTDIVRLLIEKGANIECYNPVGCTPLIIASYGNYEICEFLIQNGADVNARRTKGSNKDWTSLMYASYYSKLDIMNLLLENGALIDIRTPSLYSAYLIAAQYGTPDAVEFLINNGAELNCTDSDGDSALICAAKYEQTDIIKLLIEYGVDINIRNKDGKRAIDYAKEKRISDACKMLSNPDNYGYATRKINLNKKSDLSNTEKSNIILDDTSEIDIAEQLSKLKKLREQDLIDDEEYKAKKAELLAKM